MKNIKNDNRSESGGRGMLPGLLRVGFVILLCLLQMVLIIYTSAYLLNSQSMFYYILLILSLVGGLYIISNSSSSSYKIGWMLLMFVFPVAGFVMYLAWGNINFDRREKGFIYKSFRNSKSNLQHNDALRAQFAAAFPAYQRQVQHLESHGYPIWQNTRSHYYALGDDWWPALLKELEKAQHFILMEFFIVSDGEVWRSVFDVLKRKAAEGVEVRFMYDDMGSVLSFSRKDIEDIRDTGIQVEVFNRVNRYISSIYLNYRNHQKIVVIDGDVGFVGGTNLADEYANLYAKHGHWKDTCMRLEGDAVWSLTTIFFEMWDLNRKKLTENYDDYRPKQAISDQHGYYLPIADGPGHKPKSAAMNMYKLMVTGSQKYCYITTPYLILDDEFIDALCLASYSGVDVRIIVPNIPDHWYVDLATKSFYKQLILAGVQIYEYTPGYIHAKMVISDDILGILGSVNMDFRSFFLHYENAVWMCETPVLKDMKKDIFDTMTISRQMTLEDCDRYPWYKKAGMLIMRIFAPLL